MLALLLGCTRAEPKREARIPLSPCELSMAGAAPVSARCGKLAVPEDRTHPAGKMIELRVALIPAPSGESRLDPLLYIPGGPGEAATESFVALAPAFDRIASERDVVLVDQRGTGGSNALRCHEPPEEPPPERYAELIDSCLKSLPGDPRFYTTLAAVEDLEAVREAFGYARWNVYGGSYGTRVALAYLRAHPTRIKAAILDGVAPPEVVLGPELDASAQRTLDAVLARCAADGECHRAFPDLGADLARLRQKAAAGGSVEVADPRTGRIKTVKLSPARLALALRLMTYASEVAALLPLLVHQAAAGELGPLAAEMLLVEAALEHGIADAMGLAVICSEEAPRWTDLSETEKASPEMQRLLAGCKNWPRGEVPPSFGEPVRSDAPLLLISGELDPVTPPANAERARASLPHAKALLAPGQGHINLPRGCIPKLAARFIESPEAPLDTGCVAQLTPTPFFIDRAGPAP